MALNAQKGTIVNARDLLGVMYYKLEQLNTMMTAQRRRWSAQGIQEQRSVAASFHETIHGIYGGIVPTAILDAFQAVMWNNLGAEWVRKTYYDGEGKVIFKSVDGDLSEFVQEQRLGYEDVLRKYMTTEDAGRRMDQYHAHDGIGMLLDFVVYADRRLNVEFCEDDEQGDIWRYINYCLDTETIVDDDDVPFQYREFVKITSWSSRNIQPPPTISTLLP